MKIIKPLRYLSLLLNSLINDIKLSLNIKSYPRVVNYSITNTCNCKCLMCNIWKREYIEKTKLTPDQIGKIFSGKLFNKVKSVGISGGEPFLRDDILSIIEAINKNTKKLKNISIISNGILKDRILKKIPKIITYCKNEKINFSIMFSINGLNKTHDLISQNTGSFDKINKLLEELNKQKINFSLCTTIVKDNVKELYDILSYAKDKNQYIKFRVATIIDRLYNANLKKNFNFNKVEKIKIAKFLDGLVNNYEKNINQKIIYNSIIEQLAYSKKRSSGCHWKNEGISIDPNGNLYLCFTKSPVLENPLKNDLRNLYFKSSISQNICNECIHDYTGIHPFNTLLSFGLKKIKKILISYCYHLFFLISFTLIPILKRIKPNNETIKNVYVTGWYGTETLGDKAILAGIIKTLYKLNPGIKATVSSIIPYYTEETMYQIGNNMNYKIIGKNIIPNIKAIKESNLVIMGGGPLMEIEDVNSILFTFIIAKLFKKKLVIYNCGVGPLNSKRLKKVVRCILELSDLIMLRDNEGPKEYPDIFNKIDYKIFIDPSINYLINYNREKNKKSDYILFCLREFPRVYCNYDNFDTINNNYIESIVNLINTIVEKYKREVIFFPMNTFYYGKDDRDFYNITLKNKLMKNNLIKFLNYEYTLNETIKVFKNANIIIGMRFHSIVFGTALGIKTLSIDYDCGRGKIFGFNKLIDNEEYSINIKDISFEKLNNLFNNINTNKIFYKKNSSIMKKLKNISEETENYFINFITKN